MTNECAMLYNYEGKNNEKSSFKELSIHGILLGIYTSLLI